MRAQRPNAQEREKLRRQRSETRLIVARCNELGFEYVVNPPVWPTVGFLKKIRRDSDGNFIRDSFPTVLTPTVSVGPADYDIPSTIGFKYPSKAGFSALANKMPRLPANEEHGYPPIGTYATDYPGIEYSYTFRKAIDKDKKWMTPGPSTYTRHLNYPESRVEMGFGSCRIIWPAVPVFCSPSNLVRCYLCGEKPVGDFFHNFGNDQDMCRTCMHAALHAMKKCSLQVTERFSRQHKIKQYVHARYCGFFHHHDGTNATIEKETRKVLRQKIRVENYLYRFNAKEE
ncbi:hypothetical protein KR038_011194 [Drosophila bunnanda]|nr:hypothetical protein KR038_011194 [Drosophila bunnanda]